MVSWTVTSIADYSACCYHGDAMRRNALAVGFGGLAALFVAGFLGPVAGVSELAVFLLAAIIMTTTAFMAGRHVDHFGFGLIFGALVGLLSVPVGGEASYLAHVSGWGGLEIDDFGSPDVPEQYWALVAGLVTPWLGLPSALLGAGLGGLGALTRHQGEAVRAG